LLCLVGAWGIVRARRWQVLVLLGLPFALTLLAAALHRYPYGGSARVAQHLAPAICLLAGAGAAALIQRLVQSPVGQHRAARFTCAALALIGVAGIARDLLWPYKTEGDRDVRRIVTDVFTKARPEDQIIVVNRPIDLWQSVEWYLRQHPDRVAWQGRLDRQRLARGGGVWALSFTHSPSLPAVLAAGLVDSPRPLAQVRHDTYDLQCGQLERTMVHCEVFRWVPAAGTR
jgi:hypothetical protein